MGLTWAPWVSVSEGSSTPAGSVTAVPWGNLLALFIADPIGGIFTASGNAEQGWSDGWSSVAEGSTMPGAPVTAVALPNGRFALFIANPIGAIFTASGNAAQSWGHGWLPGPDNYRTMPGAQVSAVALANGRFALFMAGPDGGIYYASGNTQQGWGSGWSLVADNDHTEKGAPVTAVAHADGRIALFMADSNGVVNAAFGNAEQGWGNGWSPVAGGSTMPGAPVTAVALANGRIALFIANSYGVVNAALGNAEQGWGDGWSPVADGSAMPGAPVNAVALANGRFALFLADPNGGIYTASGNTQQGWGDGWSPVADERIVPGAPVTAVALASARFALFVTDSKGAVLTTFELSIDATKTENRIYVFRPGGVATGSVFTSWAPLVAAMFAVQGRKILEFDDSIVSPCVIPPGVWPMYDVVWAGFGPRYGVPRTIVEIQNGATFMHLRMIGGQITIVNKATTTSPVSDFSADRDQVQIGLRDDCGNTQIVNQGSVAMFNLEGNSALFFVQNCLFGMPTPGVDSIFPLIRHTGPSLLTINLLGQNQTGPNLVKSEPGAAVLFAALSGAAQVAYEQQKYWDPDLSNKNKLRFGPVNRIQRQVLPLPPLAAALSSQGIGQVMGAGLTLPNALIRCDGSGAGFTQVLPQIAGGFTFGSSTPPTPLYSGGQELVVAEVAGGAGLRVAPTVGDTIDLGAGSVPIAAHGSRTFVSDGESNWITTAVVP